MLPRWLLIALAILISVLWAANFVIGVIYPGRSEPALNTIFGIVAGAAFTLAAKPGEIVRRKLSRVLDRPKEDDETDRGGQS